MRLYKIYTFIKKDFRIEYSYKMAFLLGNLTILFPTIMLYFAGQMVKNSPPEGLIKYGGDYFSFALIGLAFTAFFSLAIKTFSESIRRAQMAGCLESILSSRTDPKTIVFLSSLYSFLFAMFSTILIFAISSLFFGFNISNINILSTIVAFLLSITTFMSFGIISAAGTIFFKKGEPFGLLFGTLSSILGGIVYPISSMPLWLQHLAKFVPITYSFEALRLSILKGYTITMISDQLFILGVVTAFFFPFSLWFFNWAVEKGKKNGTLMHY